MSCCCKCGRRTVSCLGRCDMPRHHCLEKEDVKPGPIPRHIGWLYTAKDSPEHQLRCGWRPGHIACPVLQIIEEHKGSKTCATCCSLHGPSCPKPCTPPKCPPLPCPSSVSCKPPAPCASELPSIRIVRHAGEYTICTKPSDIITAPSSNSPLKYVLNTDSTEDDPKNAKFSIEAKYNDYRFEYTSSQSSFVVDFTPPDQKCKTGCPKMSSCAICSNSSGCPMTGAQSF